MKVNWLKLKRGFDWSTLDGKTVKLEVVTSGKSAILNVTHYGKSNSDGVRGSTKILVQEFEVIK